MPKYGLALDNLRSAEMVMADGRVLRASADENPDLFWAIRGGGGNFGIAASLEYDLHPVGPIITGGLVAHPLPARRSTCCVLPRPVRVAAGRGDAGRRAADRAGRLEREARRASSPAIAARSTEGEAAFEPIKAFGPPVMDAMGPIPYSALNGMLDAAFPKGALNYWKAQFLTDLSDDAIQDAGRLLRGVPVADVPDRPRALPRRGEPRRRSARPRARCASPASTS